MGKTLRIQEKRGGRKYMKENTEGYKKRRGRIHKMNNQKGDMEGHNEGRTFGQQEEIKLRLEIKRTEGREVGQGWKAGCWER